MFDIQHSSKIKNDKIMRWRLELSNFCYDIIYRPGTQNGPADTLSRAYVANINTFDSIEKIHTALCHPGVTRLYHFVKTKNLPFSIDDVRNVINKCSVCARLKPNFYKTLVP